MVSGDGERAASQVGLNMTLDIRPHAETRDTRTTCSSGASIKRSVAREVDIARGRDDDVTSLH